MKPQFANMTLEEFLKEMQPYLTPDRYANMSSEELISRKIELEKHNTKVQQTLDKFKDYVIEGRNMRG